MFFHPNSFYQYLCKVLVKRKKNNKPVTTKSCVVYRKHCLFPNLPPLSSSPPTKKWSCKYTAEQPNILKIMFIYNQTTLTFGEKNKWTGNKKYTYIFYIRQRIAPTYFIKKKKMYL